MARRQSLNERFLAFDDRLYQARGQPRLSQWWRAHIGRFLDAYDRGEATELWMCVGRGGGKSIAVYKLALFFSWFGDFSIPQTETHYFCVVSCVRREANKALPILRKWCEALGIAIRAVEDVIEFDALPRGIRILTANVAGVSGHRCFGAALDEFAKLNHDAESANLDADEILSSAKAADCHTP